MAFYGRYVTNGDTDMGDVGYNQQRAYVYNKMTENGWGHRFGFWGGRFGGGGVPTVKPAIWSTTASMTPDKRLAYHNGITVNAVQSYGRDGQAYTAPIMNADLAFSPATTAVKLKAGERYALGLVSTGDAVHYAMVQAAFFTGDNEQFYSREGVTTPTTPFGYTNSSTEGWMSAWIEYQPNRAPSAATSSPTGTITTTSPRFQGTFSDADKTYGDRMTQLRIQVLRGSDSVVMWDSGSLAATTSEKSADAFDRAYAGTALVGGIEYKWRCQVADEFGAWSAWTAYRTFTVNGGGVINTQSTPSGKQTSLQPTPFTAAWRHASGFSMNLLRVRLLQGGSVIRTSGDIALTVANNGAISVSWSAAFSTYALSWSLSGLSWQMQGRDTASLWSDWSTPQAFSTNASPTIPTNLTPTNSAAATTRPLLKCVVSDADGDTLTVKARIKNNAGTVLFTRTMTRVGTSSTYQYQTTASDLAGYATYRWDAYSFDGFLYSGDVTSEASAVKSAEAIFVYAQGPIVTVTSPTSGQVFTGNPVVSWNSIPNFKDSRVTFYRADGTLMHDGGWTMSTGNVWSFPASVWGWRNGTAYQVKVELRDINNLVGETELIGFSVQYTPPSAPPNLQASPEYQRFDASPSSVRLTWDATGHAGFVEYLITRRITGQSDAEAVVLARLASQLVNVFVDYLPEAGVDYTYALTVATMQGLDVTVSDPVESQSMVSLEHVVLTDVRDSANLRVALKLDSERGFNHVDDLILEHPWGASAPVGIYGTTQYEVFNGTFTLATDDIGSAQEHINALRALWRSRATVCYRDERGRKFFGKISKFSETDRRVQFYTVDVEVTEVGFVDGLHE